MQLRSFVNLGNQIKNKDRKSEVFIIENTVNDFNKITSCISKNYKIVTL